METSYNGEYYYADYCSCNAEAPPAEEWSMYTETPYRCQDPFWCALTPPGTDPEVWKSLADELSEWRVGYFDTETTEGYAPCVSAEEMLANPGRYRLHED